MGAQENILLVNQLGQIYGAEMSLLELVTSLEDFRPIVLTDGNGDLKHALAARGVRTVVYDFRQVSPIPSDLDGDLGAILEEHSIDLVHLNKPHLNDARRFGCVEALRRLTRVRGLGMIAHVRSVEEAFDEEQARLLAKMDGIVCVSQATRAELFGQEYAAQLRELDDTTRVVYNGRTLSEYAFSRERRERWRRRFELRDDDFVVGLVARFNATKGQVRLVELARRFDSTDQVKFLVVGDLMEPADAVYRDQVVASIRKYGLERQVLLTGYLESREIMSTLDVLVSLSQTEGLPGVVIEAMAASRPVVANPVGGIPEMVDEGRTGFCVPKNDLGAMEAALRRLQSEPERAQAMGERARERAGELFATSRYAEDMARIYREQLQGADI